MRYLGALTILAPLLMASSMTDGTTPTATGDLTCDVANVTTAEQTVATLVACDNTNRTTVIAGSASVDCVAANIITWRLKVGGSTQATWKTACILGDSSTVAINWLDTTAGSRAWTLTAQGTLGAGNTLNSCALSRSSY